MRRWECWKLFAFLLAMTVVNMIAINIFCSQTTWETTQQVLERKNLPKLSLVVLVMSAPNNADRRQVIRDTWASLMPHQSVKVFFVLGSKMLSTETYNSITQEQKTYDDLILLSDIQDSYFKLTEKYLGALNYTMERYRFTYIMKCDDDTHIDSLRLLEKLKTLPASRLYWGYFTGSAHVKTSGQWAEPNFHLCDRYLPYARGGGYVITADLVEYILQNKHLLQIYNSEDVTVGVWLAALDIQRIHDTSFDTEATSRGCLNHHIVSHKQSIQRIRDKHSSLQSTGKLCYTEMRQRDEYEYSWSNPPSRCCIPGVT